MIISWFLFPNEKRDFHYEKENGPFSEIETPKGARENKAENRSIERRRKISKVNVRKLKMKTEKEE